MPATILDRANAQVLICMQTPGPFYLFIFLSFYIFEKFVDGDAKIGSLTNIISVDFVQTI